MSLGFPPGTADKLKLAPFVGVACPGLIDEHGTIVRGGQNLPGNWEGEDFNLPHEIAKRLERLGGHEPVVLMHNDAVVQGLSEVPAMQDVSQWGVLTIGTGLGNAHFTNRHHGQHCLLTTAQQDLNALTRETAGGQSVWLFSDAMVPQLVVRNASRRFF